MAGTEPTNAMPGPTQVESEELNLADSLDVGSRVELMINNVWFKARIESRCEEPMQIDGDDDDSEMELPMFWILYDATPGKAAELEDMCFLEGHRAISQKDDDKNNFGAAWWRLDGSAWEPEPGSNPHDLQEEDFDPWDDETCESFVNRLLHDELKSEKVSKEMCKLPRDGLNHFLDELGAGRRALVAKLKSHMNEKVSEDPTYVLSAETMREIMQEVGEQLNERPPPTPQF